eukprot:390163_1
MSSLLVSRYIVIDLIILIGVISRIRMSKFISSRFHRQNSPSDVGINSSLPLKFVKFILHPRQIVDGEWVIIHQTLCSFLVYHEDIIIKSCIHPLVNGVGSSLRRLIYVRNDQKRPQTHRKHRKCVDHHALISSITQPHQSGISMDTKDVDCTCSLEASAGNNAYDQNHSKFVSNRDVKFESNPESKCIYIGFTFKCIVSITNNGHIRS